MFASLGPNFEHCTHDPEDSKQFVLRRSSCAVTVDSRTSQEACGTHHPALDNVNEEARRSSADDEGELAGIGSTEKPCTTSHHLPHAQSDHSNSPKLTAQPSCLKKCSVSSPNASHPCASFWRSFARPILLMTAFNAFQTAPLHVCYIVFTQNVRFPSSSLRSSAPADSSI